MLVKWVKKTEKDLSDLFDPHELFQPQQPFYKIQVGFGHNAVFRQRAFAFFGFFGEDVPLERLLVRNLSRAGHFKPLFGAGVCFNLGHFKNAV